MFRQEYPYSLFNIKSHISHKLLDNIDFDG